MKSLAADEGAVLQGHDCHWPTRHRQGDPQFAQPIGVEPQHRLRQDRNVLPDATIVVRRNAENVVIMNSGGGKPGIEKGLLNRRADRSTPRKNIRGRHDPALIYEIGELDPGWCRASKKLLAMRRYSIGSQAVPSHSWRENAATRPQIRPNHRQIGFPLLQFGKLVKRRGELSNMEANPWITVVKTLNDWHEGAIHDGVRTDNAQFTRRWVGKELDFLTPWRKSSIAICPYFEKQRAVGSGLDIRGYGQGAARRARPPA